jgi:HSP20 family molecular chaperone IbpA
MCLFVGMTLILMGAVRAHRWGDRYVCSSPSLYSCDVGTRRLCGHSFSKFPRRYKYHRYNGPYHGSCIGRQRITAMDLVSRIFSTPYYSEVGNSVNSLFRHHNKRVDMGTSMDFPYSVEDYGDAGIELFMELPGIDANDVLVELQNDVVVISVHRRFRRRSSFASQADFSQSFQLAKDMDVDGIQVSLVSGVLIVSVPRKSRLHQHHRKIPIHVFDRHTKQEKGIATEESNSSTEENSKTERECIAAEAQRPKGDDDFEILDEEDI